MVEATGAMRLVWNLCSMAVLLGLTHAAVASEVCMRNPEEAAISFVSWSVEDAHRATELIQPDNLKLFRSRLQQVMDDRYSPDSAALRQQRLGSEWSQERMLTATDKELVGRYFLGDGSRQRNTRISDVRAVESRQVPFADREVVVTYVVEKSGRSEAGRQEFSANRLGDCWVLQLTTEAWAVLENVASILKGSREQTTMPRQGPSRLSLRIAEGSRTAREGMEQMPLGTEPTGVWIASTPLLTQDDVIEAAVAWDCDAAGFGPEEPAVKLVLSAEGSEALRRWSEVNIDSMLAVVLDSRVVSFARVATVLGPRMLLCLQGKSLEEAQVIAADLLGAR